MRILYLDLSMGAAGDMLTAALYELLDEEDKKRFLDTINDAGIPGVEIIPVESVKCGITGTHMKVTVDGREEEKILTDFCDASKPAGSHALTSKGSEEADSLSEHDHDHGHHHHHEDHGHGHHHHGDHEHEHSHDHHETHTHVHSSLHDIEHIIAGLKLPDEVKKHAVDVYTLIADAESHAHGRPAAEIHFHEVGTADAVADVTAVSLLINMLKPDRIEASYINVGGGHVHCAHGILPVPAPATAYILKDVPIYQGHVSGELCTPTGAALLKHYVNRFGSMPVMKISAAGYGMGTKDFEQANCVRAFFGEDVREDRDFSDTSHEKQGAVSTRSGSDETITELVCNVDDMTGEGMGYAVNKLLEKGALEAYTVPVYMKKSRPGMELKVLCRNEDRDEMVRLIFKHTTTLGIRESLHRRYTLDRRIEERETPYGTMRLKISEGYGILRKKWESDDIKDMADRQGISVETVINTISDLKG